MFLAVRLDTLEHGLGVETVVVQLQRIELGGHGHRLAVVAQRRLRGIAGLRFAHAAGSRAHGDAGGKALDIPFERAGKGLVEIVQVEHQVPIGRAIPAEVAEVGVAAEFDAQVRAGAGRQIAGHDHGGAAQEREGGAAHSAVAQRPQIRQAGLVLRSQQGQRIGAAASGCQLGMRRQRNGLALRAAGLAARGRRGAELGRPARAFGQ
jgi:hypothetical protein